MWVQSLDLVLQKYHTMVQWKKMWSHKDELTDTSSDIDREQTTLEWEQTTLVNWIKRSVQNVHK